MSKTFNLLFNTKPTKLKTKPVLAAILIAELAYALLHTVYEV